MQGIANSFSLPFKTRGWFGTFALQGLITLIPIVGQMATYGWALRQLDVYRQGRTELVPAGFHVGRGINVWVVWTVWSLPSLAIGVLVFLTIVPAMLTAFSNLPQPDANGVYPGGTPSLGPGFYSAMAGINTLSGLSGLYGLALALFYPAIWLATERNGIAGGLNPALIWSLASRGWGNTIVAAICIYAGAILGGLGILACCVGIIFSLPYTYAVLAGVLRYYEYSFEAPATPAGAAAA